MEFGDKLDVKVLVKSPLLTVDADDWSFEDFAGVPCVETEIYRMVGQKEATNPATCGRWLGHYGCKRVDLHNRIKVVKLRDGKEEKIYSTINKVYGHNRFCSCGKPDCEICYKFGWGVREANKAEKRLKVASETFGKVLHVVVSVPVSEYGLGDEALHRKLLKVLAARGVWGGCKIPHAFRYHKDRLYWFFSFHFHALGFLRGGYKCRGCPRLLRLDEHNVVCDKKEFCDGFEQETRRLTKKDKWIVKVLDERQTVGGTAFYQLSHASVRKGGKRHQVLTWWGCCSYRKLKVVPDKKKAECPICHHELERLRYAGCRKEIFAEMTRMLCDGGRRGFLADFYEDGREAWLEDTRQRGYG